jgi:hypothetical protein
MCFSATGSFVASGVLAGIGVAALSRNASKAHWMVAAIPLLFGAQQAAEGVVWLTIDQGDYAWLQSLAVMAFLAFALVVWPLWLPMALQRVERSMVRRRLQYGLLGAGLVVAVSAAALLIRWHPVAEVAGHCIQYKYSPGAAAFAPGVYLAAYAIPTVVPFFVSSVSLARTTGAALFLSLVAAVVIERQALTSVWCFFAAVLSGLVLATIILEQRHAGQIPPRHSAYFTERLTSVRRLSG